MRIVAVPVRGGSLKAWIGKMHSLSHEPLPNTVVEFTSLMDTVYGITQANVHVSEGRPHSGNLKASGRVETSVKRASRNEFHGVISYGSGVPYAKYELTPNQRNPSRMDWAHHPSHDPYDGLEEFYEIFENRLNEAFDR